MNTMKILIIMLSVFFYAMLLPGCTHVINPPEIAFEDFASQEKIGLNIGINIDEDLRQKKWERRYMGDTWVIPIGEWMASNSVSLANHVFTSAIDLSNKSNYPSLMVDAVLTPRVVFINRTMGANPFGDSIITVKVEWDLRSPSGNPIWIETVTGEGVGTTGWTDPDDVLEKAFHNLLRNSLSAFRSSKAIARFTKDITVVR
ncbi:MAG: hypothetical protein ACU84J_14240 [Gammaproteobacteria bacterium]